MRLTRGSQLGPYEVLSTLGSGGMAEVYRARDTRLGRDIALKVVNEALSGDPELVRRFEQEARLAGSLNHPNLVAVYDFGLHEGAPYFTTELLKGESLRQRLTRGRIPVDTALDWGSQLAQGLAAAHAEGIVHRDVKPDNVFITSDGHVKLLDFGIAKLVEASRAEGPHGMLDETVTPVSEPTRTGAIVGTPAYMSPEQVRGEPVDARTDLFSLGTVLYEMLSGRRPFAGGSLVETGHAILHDEPARLENVPAPVDQLVRRCLAKEPEGRIQGARDLAFALQMLRGEEIPHRPTRAKDLRFARWWLWALVLVAGAATGGLITKLRAPPAPAPITSERVTLRPIQLFQRARFTPDGRIVFSARLAGVDAIFERQLSSASMPPLVKNAWLLSVSPSNEFAVSVESHLLARVSGGGGTPQPVAENVDSADWSPAGELAIVRHTGVRLALEYPIGKPLLEVTEPSWISDVRVSPRGDLLAFARHPNGTLGGEAVIIDPSGKTLRVSRQWHRMAGLAWASGDELWYSAGERLSTGIQAIPLRGPERSVYEALSEIGLHDISADGRVLVGQGLFERDISFLGEGTTTPRSLAWFERDYPSRLSPDGRWMLSSGWNPQIRMIAMLRGTSGELPAILGEGYAQDLSPDGRTALLVPESTAALILRATRGETRREVPLPGFDVSTTRFAGGTDRAISVARTKSDKGYRLYSVDLRTGAVAPLSEDVVEEDHLEVSPHGRWAAVRISSGGQLVPAIVALSDGKASVMSGLGPDLSPSGWASDSELWLSRLDRSTFKLIRYDVERRRVTLEKPTVDLGGSGNVIWVRVTPDGRNTLFGQTRGSGHLYVIRGLIPVH